jgi:putative hydrolase of the HAD superfamily
VSKIAGADQDTGSSTYLGSGQEVGRARATPTSIEAVLFDLGGTLIDGRDFEGWSEDARALGLELESESMAEAWEAIKPWVNRKEDSPQQLWRDILSRASSVEVSAEIVDGFIERQREKPIFGALFSDVRRCLDLLERRHTRLAIVSNSRSEPAVRRLLRELEIEGAFELVVSSGTEGVRKPEGEIFRRALDRLGVQPKAALFVGDDIENDVQGAEIAGMHAIWLNRSGVGADGDYAEILSLSEVPRMIRLIEAGAPVK